MQAADRRPGRRGRDGQQPDVALSARSSRWRATQQLLAHADEYRRRSSACRRGRRARRSSAGRGPDLVQDMGPTTERRTTMQARTLTQAANPDASPDEIEAGRAGHPDGRERRRWRQRDQELAVGQNPMGRQPVNQGNALPVGRWRRRQSHLVRVMAGQRRRSRRRSRPRISSDAAGKLPSYVQNLTGLRKKLTDILGVQVLMIRVTRSSTPTGKLCSRASSAKPVRAGLHQRRATEWAASGVHGWAGLTPGKADPPEQSRRRPIRTSCRWLNKRAPKRGVADVNDIGIRPIGHD